jgi:hypothetical protein
MCEDVWQTVSLRSVRIVFSSEERMRSATRVNTPTDLKRVELRLSQLSGAATLSYAESSALLALLDVSSVSSEYLVLPDADEEEDDDDADDDDDLGDDDEDLDDDDEADGDDDEDLEDDDFEGDDDDDDLEDDDLEEEDED